MISESLGVVWVSNQCDTRDRSLVDDFSIATRCSRSRIHVSPVAPVSLMISESLGAVGAVESMRTRDSSSLMIYEALGAVLAVESMRHP
jgi:hypothetical protein